MVGTNQKMIPLLLFMHCFHCLHSCRTVTVSNIPTCFHYVQDGANKPFSRCINAAVGLSVVVNLRGSVRENLFKYRTTFEWGSVDESGEESAILLGFVMNLYLTIGR